MAMEVYIDSQGYVHGSRPPEYQLQVVHPVTVKYKPTFTELKKTLLQVIIDESSGYERHNRFYGYTPRYRYELHDLRSGEKRIAFGLSPEWRIKLKKMPYIIVYKEVRTCYRMSQEEE